jgi:hypothetical protein
MPEDVIIGDRLSFANQVRLSGVSNLRCSWEISRIGLLSCDVPLDDLPAALSPPETMLRKWITYTHPTAGTWGGVINSISVRNRIVTLDCESWATMFRGFLTNDINSTTVLGALAEVIGDAKPYTGITYGGYTLPDASESSDYYLAGDVDDTGLFSNGMDLYDAFLQAVLNKLYDEHAWRASLRGLAYNIDPVTRVFSLDFTYGRNLTSTVRIMDGVHCVDSGWTDDIEETFNQVYYTSNEYFQNYGIVGSHTVHHNAVTTPGDCIQWKWNKKHTKKVCVLQGTNTTPASDETVIDYGYYQDTRVCTAFVQDATSVASYGARNLYVTRGGIHTDHNACVAFAQGLVADLARNEQLITMELVDEGSIFAAFREGDLVRVTLGNSGRDGTMIARSRALDTTRGTLLVSGVANLTASASL